MTTIDLPVRSAAGRSLLIAMRPKQWVKNLLVFAAPMAGGALLKPHVAVSAVVTFVAFTCASAGCYLVNDIHDVDNDRLHPQKRTRPLAAGEISVGGSATAAIIALSLGMLLLLPLDREWATVVLLVYVMTVLMYGARLKHVPGVELAVLASGFVLRPLAGAAATGVAPSPWFLLVCCFAALTIALGKRQVELARLAATAGLHRASLASYSRRWLRLARLACAAGLVSAYTLWALSRATPHDRLFAILTLVPVIGAVARLHHLNDGGIGDAPEVVLLSDRWLQLCCVAWLVLFVVGLGRV